MTQKKKIQYDIFISYRRSSYDVANLIATRLQSAGYRVFFDMEKLRSGKFNEQLFDVIDHCTDFVLVLPPNALDRCVNEDDWVRLETCRAMAGKKNIVPVMLNGFKWPNPMPKGMEDLNEYQALVANSVEFFDLAMERLQQRYLLSKPHLPIIKILKLSAVAIFSLLALVSIIFGVFLGLSQSVCKQYAIKLTNDVASVYLLAEGSAKLEPEWEKFNNAVEYNASPRRIADQQKILKEDIDQLKKDIESQWNSSSEVMQIPTYHGFLLSIRGINAEEVAYSPALATLYLEDYRGKLDLIIQAVEDPTVYKRKHASTLLKAFKHEITSYYSTALATISEFPKSCRKVFYQISPTWIHFPQTIELDRDEEYYVNIFTRENNLAMELLKEFSAYLSYEGSVAEELERKNDNLDGEIVAKVDNNLNEFHEKLLQTRNIEEGDDQWLKWSKIRSWGGLVSIVADYKREFEALGLDYNCKLTPAKAYAEVESRLDQYLAAHPESADYVASAKQFFKEVSLGKRTYGGVLIYAFKDEAEHSFFEKGDIVVKYDNKSIANLKALKSAFGENENGEVTYMRLENDTFKPYKNTLQKSDIVGFIDITEEE